MKLAVLGSMIWSVGLNLNFKLSVGVSLMRPVCPSMSLFVSIFFLSKFWKNVLFSDV